MEKLNLYIVDNKSRSSLYGVGTYIRELVVALKGYDIRPYVVSLFHEQSKVEQKEEDVVYWNFPEPISKDWHRLDMRQRNTYVRNIVYLLRYRIQKQDNLVFHLNSYRDKLLARELKAAFDCKVVMTAHFSDWTTALFDNLPRFRRILRKEEGEDEWGDLVRESFEEERSCYAAADRVICLSAYMHDVLCRDYGLERARISIIPNGLKDQAGQGMDLSVLRAKWHAGPEERLILFVGRLDPIKGFRYLIEAFHKVLETIPESRLVIVGDGNYNEALDAAASSRFRITFTGFLPPDALYELYRLADVGVVPSLFEPFGYVPVEMMMHGLPVVATATSGLNEVVDETCGRKVPLTVTADRVTIDTDRLAEAIVGLLRDPAEARRLGRGGRERYERLYTSEVFGQNMRRFYQEIMS